MSILVTGCSGYIGTELCRRFEADKSIKKIIGIDLSDPKEHFKKLSFYKRDCCENLEDIFISNSIKVVIHLVFVMNPLHNKETMYRINVKSLENILEYVQYHNIKRVVVTSSGTAYGAYPNNPDRISEKMPIRGHAYQYSNDKRIVEEKLMKFQYENSAVDIVIARPAVICGPHIGNFISRYVTKLFVPLVKNSSARIQFLHEEDAANALYTLVNEAPSGAYNLGPEETLTQDEVVSITGKIPLRIGPKILRFMNSIGWFLRFKFLTEVPSSMLDFIEFSWVVDGTKIERHTSFRYKYSSADAIHGFIQKRTN